MKISNYTIPVVILSLLTIITMIFMGFSYIGLLNSFFLSSLILLCTALFLMIYSDGAFSIIGHSFRRAQYLLAPKPVKESMESDKRYTNKTPEIIKKNYSITMPLLIVSIIGCVTSLILSFMAMWFTKKSSSIKQARDMSL